jgi:hypothetical protein
LSTWEKIRAIIIFVIYVGFGLFYAHANSYTETEYQPVQVSPDDEVHYVSDHF